MFFFFWSFGLIVCSTLHFSIVCFHFSLFFFNLEITLFNFHDIYMAFQFRFQILIKHEIRLKFRIRFYYVNIFAKYDPHRWNSIATKFIMALPSMTFKFNFLRFNIFFSMMMMKSWKIIVAFFFLCQKIQQFCDWIEN